MRAVLISLLTLFTFTVYSQTHEFTLDNGLKIIVKEDHRAPVAVSMVWYNVGSADEKGGFTGLSHVLEHLMFKGTPNYPVGVFSKIVASLGGQENAFTNNDYTAYYEKIATPHLATSFALEADRMQNLLLDKEEFAHEIKVIQEERRLRTDDNPQALTFERFLATAHLASPYHHPVIGWMSDLEHTTVEDAKDWYQKYYSPNNATLVVVGDVNPQEVYKLAKKYFGPIGSHALPLRKPQEEPPAYGKKSVIVKAPAQVPLLLLGYTVPSVKTTDEKNALDPYVLEVIGSILDAGDSGRVSQNLIRGKHIASTVDVYYNLYARYQTQFIIYGSPSQHHSIAEVKQGIFDELNRLKDEKVSNEELMRVKTQIIAQKIFERDSIFEQAMELGMLQTVGLGWQTADKYVEKINSVTPEQIQSVAKRYFNENSLTEAELIPQGQQKA
ncbi:zinc protease (peptidase, M16 family) (plasmid) [Legionella adelaidensis]|uniref:Zinc protease n=1 Tax=Legionella adelaidensis TaxID=45056 RepID=A0A0W0R0P0_9GAMM|nr:pitrilysin family protein [Legionella adelaidensis]KTC64505.1 zinc protease [Legionella adelaidensis]VEH85873.1 zinc protease (peptidase, M16 family) [Legionella adelaidensis]